MMAESDFAILIAMTFKDDVNNISGGGFRCNTTANSKSFNLIVCGFTNYEHDGFGFADFLAYCTTFGKKNVDGTFLSCFDVDKHFGHLSFSNIKHIKFGLLKNGQHILSFDRF